MTAFVKLNQLLLYVFLFLVFIIHYQTHLFFGTLHSWLLVLGILVTLPQIAHKCIRSDYTLPLDYTIVGFILVFLVLGFIVNIDVAQSFYLKTYLLSLACYLFVREAMPAIPLRHFYRLNTLFLVGNSGLMIAQVLTGGFFVAKYLAAGNPPLQVPSGFADGPTKNGMIHSAALSLVFAQVAFLRVPVWSLEVVALVLGGLSLLATVSRAAVASFVIAVIMTAGLAMMMRRSVSAVATQVQSRKRRMLPVAVVAVLAVTAVYVSVVSFNSQMVASDVGRWTAAVVAYKFTPHEATVGPFDDPSLNTRVATIRAAGVFMADHPIRSLLGSGMGTFEGIYAQIAPMLTDTGVILVEEISAHNSYLEFMVEGGIITWCLWMYLTVHVVRKVLRRPDAAAALPVLAALISTMGFMMFHDVLRGRMFWVPLAILASIAYADRSPDIGIKAPRARR